MSTPSKARDGVESRLRVDVGDTALILMPWMHGVGPCISISFTIMAAHGGAATWTILAESWFGAGCPIMQNDTWIHFVKEA